MSDNFLEDCDKRLVPNEGRCRRWLDSGGQFLAYEGARLGSFVVASLDRLFELPPGCQIAGVRPLDVDGDLVTWHKFDSETHPPVPQWYESESLWIEPIFGTTVRLAGKDYRLLIGDGSIVKECSITRWHRIVYWVGPPAPDGFVAEHSWDMLDSALYIDASPLHPVQYGDGSVLSYDHHVPAEEWFRPLCSLSASSATWADLDEMQSAFVSYAVVRAPGGKEIGSVGIQECSDPTNLLVTLVRTGQKKLVLPSVPAAIMTAYKDWRDEEVKA